MPCRNKSPNLARVMELREIIDEIASQADDFLANSPDRGEARAAVTELITSQFPDLSEKARRVVLDGVMHLLEDEDFFGPSFTAGTWADDAADDED